ncbi:esterase-like activity of phytase family protein [Pseudoalteromonas sp. T1lg65]|uniref:esterase-like activity of phytase family protein n=1 Tax=Pseudoalteromonas sp. T1lg65 TaxID=2077101 RepID=UPI003F79C52C
MNNLGKSLLAVSLLTALVGCSGDDGKDGVNGSDGVNGVNSLVRQDNLLMGDETCFFGGVQINSGPDGNADGQLSDDEIDHTSFVCDPSSVSQQGTSLPYSVMRNDLQNGLVAGSTFEIRNGGYGSDMVAHPTNPTQFYALTDRGPNANYTGQYGKGKTFPTPEYTPRIGLFELKHNGQVVKVKDILLKRPDGTLITGLPNSADLGGTGETPYDTKGDPILQDSNSPYNEQTNPIKLDNFGLDGEGLVALSDGTFWISDEYGPHIVHFDAQGKEIDRINAFANDERVSIQLPAEFANRRANRGMEGLAITPDETTLVGVMQSTMHNPNGAVKNSDLVRIITINLESRKASQFLYRQEKKQNSNSGIVALSDQEFLVIERDGTFFSQNPNAMKRIYKIKLDSATDLETVEQTSELVQNPELGLTISGQTIEQVSIDGGWEKLEVYGIVPVQKQLVIDLVEQVNYPHDKLEGMWLIDKTRLAVLNDDDFATWSTAGVLEQKYLDAAKSRVDSNTLYLIEGLELDK